MKNKSTKAEKLSFIAALTAIILTCLHLIFLLLTFSQRLRFRYIYPHLKTMTIVILAVSFILAVIGITYGFILRKKRKTTMINWSIWLGIIWLAFPIILAVGSFKISSILKEYKANPQGLTEEEQIIMRCKSNQEQLELIANEFWKRDHPDATKEDIKSLDLGPEGDLLGIKKGNRFIYYTGEPAIFNCPSDEDMEDIDYAIDHIDGDGYIHIKCIQNEQHNK